MIVREIEDADLIDRLGKSSGPRSEGLHQSTIIKALMKRLQPARFGGDKPMNMQLIEVGLLFENMLERALAEKFSVVRPGEMFSDEGIAMSPDGLNPEAGALEEFKATYMSSRSGFAEQVEVDGEQYWVVHDKFLHWVYQICGYLHVLGMNDAIVRVLFVCGDYSRPITPQFKSWHLHFTNEEIESKYQTLLTVAREEGLL